MITGRFLAGREDCDVLTGEIFVVPQDEQSLLDRLQHATDLAHRGDYDLYDVNMVPVHSLDP